MASVADMLMKEYDGICLWISLCVGYPFSMPRNFLFYNLECFTSFAGTSGE
jgi:hypothetical protein